VLPRFDLHHRLGLLQRDLLRHPVQRCQRLPERMLRTAIAPEAFGLRRCLAMPGSAAHAMTVIYGGAYQLTGIDRVDTDAYRAQSGASTVLIRTRNCQVLTMMDSGALVCGRPRGLSAQLLQRHVRRVRCH
jgi:hypothetical protein